MFTDYDTVRLGDLEVGEEFTIETADPNPDVLTVESKTSTSVRVEETDKVYPANLLVIRWDGGF